MIQLPHPLALDPRAVRLLERSFVDIEELLGADSFSVDGNQVAFQRHRSPSRPAQHGRRGTRRVLAATWRGHIGDWVVRDGNAHWRIVSEQPVTVGQLPPAPVTSTAAEYETPPRPVGAWAASGGTIRSARSTTRPQAAHGPLRD